MIMSGLGGPSEERGLHLIHLLLACATHVASRSIENADICLDYISHLSSPHGDTMQRIAAYFTQALADRMLKASWPGMYKALNSTTTASDDQLLVQTLFFHSCPFLKLSYVITNLAILEAMEGEKLVHIIDLHSFDPTQWLTLLQALKARPEGPPHLRITAIHHHKDVLDHMARRLNQEAEKLDIPFQFNPLVCRLENLDTQCLRVKTGEAVAVASVLRLHSLLAVDDDTCGTSLDSASSAPMPSSTSKIMSFLNAIWCLSPKLLVVTEQESNHNGGLMDRMMEALNFYAALFDCMASTMPRTSMERLKIERMLFGVEIKNIIACEGLERKERHEKLEKWIPRLELAGFRQVPLSYHVMMQARRLVQSCNYDAYKIKGENGCFIICWQDQPLFFLSAWRFRRYKHMSDLDSVYLCF